MRNCSMIYKQLLQFAIGIFLGIIITLALIPRSFIESSNSQSSKANQDQKTNSKYINASQINSITTKDISVELKQHDINHTVIDTGAPSAAVWHQRFGEFNDNTKNTTPFPTNKKFGNNKNKQKNIIVNDKSEDITVENYSNDKKKNKRSRKSNKNKQTDLDVNTNSISSQQSPPLSASSTNTDTSIDTLTSATVIATNTNSNGTIIIDFFNAKTGQRYTGPTDTASLIALLSLSPPQWLPYPPLIPYHSQAAQLPILPPYVPSLQYVQKLYSLPAIIHLNSTYSSTSSSTNQQSLTSSTILNPGLTSSTPPLIRPLPNMTLQRAKHEEENLKLHM